VAWLAAETVVWGSGAGVLGAVGADVGKGSVVDTGVGVGLVVAVGADVAVGASAARAGVIEARTRAVGRSVGVSLSATSGTPQLVSGNKLTSRRI